MRNLFIAHWIAAAWSSWPGKCRRWDTGHTGIGPTAAKGSASEIKRTCIENEFFRVTLDPARCGIRSIVCKKTGRELVNTQSPYALGQYLYERFDADQAASFTSAYVLSPKSGEMISHGKPKLPSAKEHPYCAAMAEGATVEIRSNAVSASPCSRPTPAASFPMPRSCG